MAKTVCIVGKIIMLLNHCQILKDIAGAGPSGLVAAKTLLQRNFKVRVYEAQDAIGGLWPTSKTDTGRQIHPMMVMNQSKHTVHFSDHAWEDGTPQMPQAWMTGQYLERYTARYLTPNPDFELKLSSRVVKTAKTASGWDVTVKSAEAEETHNFEYLLVASGYFGKPVMAQKAIEGASVPVVHSSQYRDLKQLLGTAPETGRKILVVGGQMSGVEIASTIASHLSTEANSPSDSAIPNIADYKIHHIIQRPVWVLPLFTTPEPKSKAPHFVPLDVNSYNRNNGRPRPLTNTQAAITEETAQKSNAILETILGTDQAAFSLQLKIAEPVAKLPVHLSISDWYLDFVRSGAIELSTGKLDSVSGTSAHITTGSTIDNVAAIVLATGFDPSSCLDFLPEDVLQAINYSPEHPSQVAALAFHATHHPNVANLGFVGFYRGPHWGVMEMQARYVAQLWSDEPPTPIFSQKLQNDNSIELALSRRDNPMAPQFPFGDYAYLMQEFGEALSIDIAPELPTIAPKLASTDLPLSPLTPSCYTTSQSKDAELSLQSATSVTEDALTTPRFVSRAVFRSLLGTWNLERDLTSRLPSHPSGHFSGTAQFLLRQRTKDGLQCAKDGTPAEGDESGWEYLYIEDGEFKTEQGFGFRATRRYVYRYDEATDKLSVWFAKPDEPKTADYLFHEVEFGEPDDRLGWSATSGHLCIDDFYDVKYRFKFNSVNLERWSCEYTVNGPKKDYSIRGVYIR